MSGDDEASAARRTLETIDYVRATAAAKEAHRRELSGIIEDFLAIVDSLEGFVRSSADGKTIISERTCRGILRQATDALRKVGVTPIDTLGLPVNLSTSEVVEVRADTEFEEDVVVEEVARGYQWRDQVLRHAKVAIASGRQECGFLGSHSAKDQNDAGNRD